MRATMVPIAVGVAAGIIALGVGLAVLESTAQAVAWLMGDDRD